VISDALIPISNAVSATTAPALPLSASLIAASSHLRASSIRSCILPWRRFPTPLTPSIGLRAIHFFSTMHHLKNVLAAARIARWLSTACRRSPARRRTSVQEGNLPPPVAGDSRFVDRSEGGVRHSSPTTETSPRPGL
jgi:hypothetical protein